MEKVMWLGGSCETTKIEPTSDHQRGHDKKTICWVHIIYQVNKHTTKRFQSCENDDLILSLVSILPINPDNEYVFLGQRNNVVRPLLSLFSHT